MGELSVDWAGLRNPVGNTRETEEGLLGKGQRNVEEQGVAWDGFEIGEPGATLFLPGVSVPCMVSLAKSEPPDGAPI